MLNLKKIKDLTKENTENKQLNQGIVEKNISPTKATLLTKLNTDNNFNKVEDLVATRTPKQLDQLIKETHNNPSSNQIENKPLLIKTHKPSKSIGGNGLLKSVVQENNNNQGKNPQLITANTNSNEENNALNLLKKIKIGNKHKKTVNTQIWKYSVKSRAGNNCDGTRKINQDSYIAQPKIINFEDYSGFGVFDGHGK